jgi:hypothetical protein
VLTFSELFLVKNEIEVNDNGNNNKFRVEGVLGLPDDQKLKLTPSFQLVKVLENFEIPQKSQNSKNSESAENVKITIVAHVYLLNGGILDLYYLMKETDNLMYFRLQRKFSSLGQNLIAFHRINKHILTVLNCQNQLSTVFFDKKSTQNSICKFRKQTLKHEILH